MPLPKMGLPPRSPSHFKIQNGSNQSSYNFGCADPSAFGNVDRFDPGALIASGKAHHEGLARSRGNQYLFQMSVGVGRGENQIHPQLPQTNSNR